MKVIGKKFQENMYLSPSYLGKLSPNEFGYVIARIFLSKCLLCMFPRKKTTYIYIITFLGILCMILVIIVC